jgi:hypothetical protein
MEFGQFRGICPELHQKASIHRRSNCCDKQLRIKKEENLHFLRCVVRLIEVIEVTQPNLEHSFIKYV